MSREGTTKYKTEVGTVHLTEQELGILELLNDEVYVYVSEKDNRELFDIVFNLYTRDLFIKISSDIEYGDKWSFSIAAKGKLIFRTDEYKNREKKNNRNKIIDNILK